MNRIRMLIIEENERTKKNENSEIYDDLVSNVNNLIYYLII